jgi:hypothetical protein
MNYLTTHYDTLLDDLSQPEIANCRKELRRDGIKIVSSCVRLPNFTDESSLDENFWKSTVLGCHDWESRTIVSKVGSRTRSAGARSRFA